MEENGWLIHGGCPRSGTTMMTRVLNSNKKIFLANEQNLSTLLDKQIPGLFLREKKIAGVIDREKGKKENWRREHILQDTFKFSRENSVELLRTLFKLNYGAEINNGVWLGEKLPDYWKKKWTIVEESLSPKVIHITRHPLDVVNSYLRRAANTKKGKDYWKKDSTSAALDDWVDAWTFIQSQKNNFNYLHIKYEDLIFKSSESLQYISDFLQVPNLFDESIIVKEHHYEREMITPNILNEVNQRLNGIEDCWDSDLEFLVDKFYFENVDIKKVKGNISLKKKTETKYGEKSLKKFFLDKILKERISKITKEVSKTIVDSRLKKFEKKVAKNIIHSELASKQFSKGLTGVIERRSIMEVMFNFLIKNQIKGDYLEFGCFQGKSLVHAFKAYEKTCTDNPEYNDVKFFVFDSFEGLPELDIEDELEGYTAFQKGDYSCTLDGIKENLINSKVDLDKFSFIEGYYDKTLSNNTHGVSKAMLIHIDCDLYSSAKSVLNYILPFLQDGTVLVFDDYYCYRGNPTRGVRKAFDEWSKVNNIHSTPYYQYSWAGQSFIVNLGENY